MEYGRRKVKTRLTASSQLYVDVWLRQRGVSCVRSSPAFGIQDGAEQNFCGLWTAPSGTENQKKIDISCAQCDQKKKCGRCEKLLRAAAQLFFHGTPFYQSWSVPAKLSVQHSTSRPIRSQQTCMLCHDGCKQIGLCWHTATPRTHPPPPRS